MIRMKSFFGVLALGIWLWWISGSLAIGQTVERDTTITGPRGRTIERQVEIQREPGSIDRQVQIKRPGGTFERQVQIQRSPAGGPWRPPIGRPVAAARLDSPARCGRPARAGVRVWTAGRADVELLVRRRRWWIGGGGPAAPGGPGGLAPAQAGRRPVRRRRPTRSP